jgi:uncharacterized membrane protein YgcG
VIVAAIRDRVWALALSLCWLAGGASLARADEKVLDYRVDVAVQRDGSLSVAEHIRVRAEGNQIRRGIYRDVPTRYEDRYGNNVVVDLTVVGVERDGRPEPWFTERLDNGVRINTGSDALLPLPGEFEFTLRYVTTRQLGFFPDHDELYWNAIGTGWAFWIDKGSADVELPAPVPAAQMSVEGYTGYQGAQGKDYTAEITAPGRAHFALTRPLAAREGFTIVVAFPKGVVPEPTRAQRVRWFLHDNRGVLIALCGLLLMLAYCAYEWRRVGRDPDKGVIIPRYEPPKDHTPAGLRYVQEMGYDNRCFSSEVLALAVRGYLHIEREDRMLGRDRWELAREAPQRAVELPRAEGALLDALFAFGDRIELKNSNARVLSSARAAHAAALKAQAQPRYFKVNAGSVFGAFAIAALSAALAFFVAKGAGVPAIIAVVVVMAVALIVFARLVRAPTRAGRKLLDEIEGLKLYLSVAERDELARMRGPGGAEPAVLDAARYEALLPFAVALEVEDAWTAKFTAAVGAAAAASAAAGMRWYRGGHIGDLGAFSRSIGSSLSSQIASASTPPGSSSGSGGGGSSGGGGGGGGGGGR